MGGAGAVEKSEFWAGVPEKKGAAVGRKNWAGVVGVKPQW